MLSYVRVPKEIILTFFFGNLHYSNLNVRVRFFLNNSKYFEIQMTIIRFFSGLNY
jgi:hypothetical protein